MHVDAPTRRRCTSLVSSRARAGAPGHADSRDSQAHPFTPWRDDLEIGDFYGPDSRLQHLADLFRIPLADVRKIGIEPPLYVDYGYNCEFKGECVLCVLLPRPRRLPFPPSSCLPRAAARAACSPATACSCHSFYANFGCVFLDCAKISFGKGVLLGPGVHVYCATHSVHLDERIAGYERAYPVEVSL